MSLDKVHEAKERGWQVMLVEYTTKRDPNGDLLVYWVLITPSREPVHVIDKEGYGDEWGDCTEEEAWTRLPAEF